MWFVHYRASKLMPSSLKLWEASRQPAHYFLYASLSYRQNMRSVDFLKAKTEDYQNCCVQYCIWQFCKITCTLIWTGLRPLTHAPETITWRQIPAPVFRADARLLTSMTAFGSWRQSMTLEVVHRHEKLAPASGVALRPMAPISGASFWSICHQPYIRFFEI